MTATPRSPLDHLHDAMRTASDRTAGAVALRELPFLAQLGVRADAASRPLLERAFSVELPTQPNCWRSGEPEAYWLGPDEWLIVGAAGTQATLEACARDVLQNAWGTAVDVSDQRTALELSGPAATDVLAGGCPLDLHARAFGPTSCAQTLVARTGALIARQDDGSAPAFRIFVRSSFAAYLAEWLLDAMSEHEPAAVVTS